MKQWQTPEIEVIRFDDDIITASASIQPEGIEIPGIEFDSTNWN